MLKRIFFLALGLSIPLTAQANVMEVYLAVGPALSKADNNSNLVINSLVTNRYTPSNGTVANPLIAFGIGHTFDSYDGDVWQTALDLTGYYNWLTTKGVEYPFITGGNFDALDYKYNFASAAILLEPRITYTEYNYQPYAFIGVGRSWNTMSNYQETPANPSSSAAPLPIVFANNREASFAYELGFGVQKQIAGNDDYYSNVCYFASIDYRYMNFGHAELGSFPGLTSGDRLTVSNTHTQALVFSIKASF